MSSGLAGADSSAPVTSALIQSASAVLGATPVFWGRYFTSVSTSGSVEYRHSTENPPLAAAGIRLLPVARQTKNVAGSQAQGLADGQANAKDFLTTFGIDYLRASGGRFYMFLDVEGDPSLTEAYYIGWAQGLAEQSVSQSGATVQVLPCVYGTQKDVTTWTAVQSAMAAGTPCFGAWIARYFTGSCSMGDWESDIVTPASPSPFPVPILAWQYAGNCDGGQIDCSQTNPGIDAQSQLLRFLVLPPGAATAVTT